MKSTCNTNVCPTESANSECADNSPAKCFNEASAAGCPIEGATQMWAGAFGEAMHQAQTEILKKKIVQAWGPMMEQAADAMMETMGALWAEKVAQVKFAEAKSSFQERLKNLWLQDSKK